MNYIASVNTQKDSVKADIDKWADRASPMYVEFVTSLLRETLTCTTCTIASELYTVAILSFISAGRAQRGRTRQHNVGSSTQKPRAAAFHSVPVGESSTEPALGRCRLSSGSRLSSFSAASIYFQPLRMHIQGFQHLPLGLDRGHLE